MVFGIIRTAIRTLYHRLVANTLPFVMGKPRHRTTGKDHDRNGPEKNWKDKFGYDYSKDYSDKSWPYAHGRLDWSAKVLIIMTPIIVISLITFFKLRSDWREMVRTPLDAPKVIPSSATSAREDPERFWGTYRSNVYFGMKTRSKYSPVVGLMWMPQLTGEMPPPIRHWCSQDDRLSLYSWFAHDGRTFGVQELADGPVTLTTSFVKRPGGNHGGDWTARISVSPLSKNSPERVMSFFFYTALDHNNGQLNPQINGDHLSSVSGFSEELGNFKILFPKSSENLLHTNYLLTHAEDLDKLKETMMSGFRWARYKKDQNYLALGGRMIPREFAGQGPNFIVTQLTVKAPYHFEVVFESGSFTEKMSQMSGKNFDVIINKQLSTFNDKFESLFNLQKKGFSDDDISFAKGALSNMLGGMGYFYGHSLVRSKYTPQGETYQYWDAPLYTGVPSRSFFPRGFLWDEGFHNLLIHKWDQEISMDVIGHWMDLMNIEGWIPREQILGSEARARVPAEFVVQHNKNANPPTFFLPLKSIVKSLIKSDDPKHKLYLANIYPRLKTWYHWFNNTQHGAQFSTYRWRGRDDKTQSELNPKTLTSGLDDYPRASHPTAEEYHLDLRCWMALASGVMADIAQSLGEDHAPYKATYLTLKDNQLLDKLHWSEKHQQYSDYGLHTSKAKLERPMPKNLAPGQRPPNPNQIPKIRVVKKEPTYTHVESFGYVSLFPFLLRLVEPDSLKLGIILKDLQDPNLLWTPYGLRSLAKNSPFYNKHNTEHDPPYWRGAIWININYLAVGALHHYGNTEGPYQETASNLYKDLRQNLIKNMISQFRNTGYIWEQYDDKTGQGKGSHPFTGWSGLIVAIMAELF